MEKLDRVQGVKEHMEKISVKIGMEISKERIKKGLTKSQVVDKVKQDNITIDTIGRVECGDESQSVLIYEKILKAILEI